MVTLGYQHKWISQWARQALARSIRLAPIDSSETMTLSYAFHVLRGLYFNNSLSYTDNPVLVPQHPGSLVLSSTVYLSL